MSPETRPGNGPLSAEDLASLDLGHMRGLADALEPELARLLLSQPFDQNKIVLEAGTKAKIEYEALGHKYKNKVVKVEQILQLYSEGRLPLSDLLKGLGLKEPEEKQKGKFGGLFKRH